MSTHKKRLRKPHALPFRPIMPHPSEPEPEPCLPPFHAPSFPLAPLHLAPAQHSIAQAPLFQLPPPDRLTATDNTWAPKNLNNVLVTPDITVHTERKREFLNEEEDGLRRETKKLKEKDRRDRLHTKFSEISAVLGVADEPKGDRVSMLGKILDLVHRLQQENSQLREEKAQFQHANKQLAAYIQFAAPGESIEDIIKADARCWRKAPLHPETSHHKADASADRAQSCTSKASKLLGALPQSELLALDLRAPVFESRTHDHRPGAQRKKSPCASPDTEDEDTSPLA